MNGSPAGAGPRNSGTNIPETLTADADPAERSRGSTLLRVDKTSSFSSGISLQSDTCPLLECYTLDGPVRQLFCLTRPAGRRTIPHSPPQGPERERWLARQPARPLRRQAGSPERAAGANRGAHQLDQPEAAPCGPTRNAGPQAPPATAGRASDIAVAVRCGPRRPAGLYLTFVRTTQERPTLPSTASTPLRWSQ